MLDVDRYRIDGKDRALVLGVRELDQGGILRGRQNWSNLHTVYTHGNGVIAAYANQRPGTTRRSGGRDPVGRGPAGHEDALSELFPDGYENRVYYGEQSPDYSIVGKVGGGPDVELDLGDAGTDDEGETTTYDGEGGVEVGSLLDQLMYAVKFGEPNFLLSERVNDNSKVLYYREPLERVEKVAPWLTLDEDPYPAVVDGRIVWIIDGYTTTDRYPLAQKESFEEMTDDSLDDGSQFGTLPTDEINYMRNAVKATVDAYDGTVTLYAWDESDPILQAWRGAFPGTVQDREDVPDSLMEHLRYPEDLFKVQRYQFARYHVTEARRLLPGQQPLGGPAGPRGARQLPAAVPHVRAAARRDGSVVRADVGVRAAREEQPGVLRLGQLRRDQRPVRRDEGPPAAERADARPRPDRQRDDDQRERPDRAAGLPVRWVEADLRQPADAAGAGRADVRPAGLRHPRAVRRKLPGA